MAVPVTAVDVDALAKLREAATAGLWSALENVGVLDGSNDPERDRAYLNAQIAAALEPLLAEVRQGRALRDFAEWVVSLDDDDPESPGRIHRRTVTLTEIVDKAIAVLAAVDGGGQR